MELVVAQGVQFATGSGSSFFARNTSYFDQVEHIISPEFNALCPQMALREEMIKERVKKVQDVRHSVELSAVSRQYGRDKEWIRDN